MQVEEKALGADTIAIRKLLPPNVQILFFSATYTKEILAYARQVTLQYIYIYIYTYTVYNTIH